MRTKRLLFLLLVISLQCPFLFAQTPQETNLQIHHQVWTFKDGAPENIASLAQTTDGFLWLGTSTGLFRYDGLKFERFQSPFGDQLLSTNVYSLFAPPTGGLWIGFTFGGMSFINHGRVTSYGDESLGPTGTVDAFAQDRDGVVWAASTHGLLRFEHSVWQHVEGDWNLPVTNVSQIGLDRDGILWLLGENHLYYLRPRSKQFELAEQNMSPAGFSVVGFSFDVDGLVVKRPTRPPVFNGNSNQATPGFPLFIDQRTLILDRNNGAWVCGNKVYRLTQREPLEEAIKNLSDSNAQAFPVESYYYARFVDREGNIWFGDLKGIHRLFYSPLIDQELPKPQGDFAMAPDADGAMWITSWDVPYFFHVRNGEVDVTHKIAESDQNSSVAYRAADKTFWFGGNYGLLHFTGRDWVQIALPPEVHPPIQAITEDSRGGLWMSFQSRGFYRFADGVWTLAGGRNDLPKKGVVTEFTDKLGRVWFGLLKSKLVMLDGDRVQEFGPNDGLRVGNITAIYGRGPRIWIGGEFGVQLFDNGRFHDVTPANDELLRGVSGIVETASGDLWLNGLAGVVHLSQAEVSEALRNPGYQVRGERFDRRAGLVGLAPQIAPLPSALEGTDGKLWFAVNNGVMWVDPNRPYKKTEPPSITIQSVSADNKPHDFVSPLTFPARTGSVEINFTAVSLSNPEAIRFRYKLQEKDNDWHEVRTANPVIFRNLSPGSYHFLVAASDMNGVWSDNVATVDFTILPAWYQTRWFFALCIIAGLFVVWVIYRLRVRQVAKVLGVRFDERLAERTRLARELHDTLLQTVQGSKLVADSALEKPDDASHLHQSMKQLSGWLGQATQEGRAALNSLRTSTTETNDLIQGLRRATEECVIDGTLAIKFSVTGARRAMHPIARDEIYRIGYEAIRNACEHAAASELEVHLNYADDLTLRVSDNGSGIEPSIVAEGRSGHFGLQGMRERAERIGSELTLVSSPNTGTVITLVVPGKVIYRNASPTRFDRIKTFLGLKNGTPDLDGDHHTH